MKKLLLSCALAAFMASFPVLAAPHAVAPYETAGILNDDTEGQLTPNVWQGMSHAKALSLVKVLPTRYESPVYYELARRLLLSDAPAIKSGDVGDGDLLTARLDKLIAMGALRDADQLYSTVTGGEPQTMELAFRGMTVLMLRNQLPAVCLDVQTFKEKFGKAPLWQDMNKVCTIALEDDVVAKAKALENAALPSFPTVVPMLKGQFPNTPEKLNPTELAFAVALGGVNVDTMRVMSPRAQSLPTLLLSVFREMASLETEPTFACVVTSLAERGGIDASDLRTMYDKARFDGSLLKAGADTSRVPSCSKPILAYQLASENAKGDADPLQRTMALAQALGMVKSTPMTTVAPLAKLIGDGGKLAMPARLTAARLSAAFSEKMPPSESFDDIWPYAVLSGDLIGDKKGVEAWQASALPSHAPSAVDAGRALVLAAANAGTEGDSKYKSGYEKFLPLTLSKSYVKPEEEIAHRLDAALDDNRIGDAVGAFLVAYGDTKPADIDPAVEAGFISKMGPVGLRRLMRRLAIESLGLPQ